MTPRRVQVSVRGLGQAAAPAADVCLACVLACVPAAPTVARSAVAHALTGRVDGRVLADAELMVSELVTNSVEHAGLGADDFVRIGAAVTEGVLRLEIDNPGATGIVAPRDPDSERSGFGLRIVETLADAWGVRARATPASGSSWPAGPADRPAYRVS